MTRKFGVLGYPLGHSLSPQIHNELFAMRGDHDFTYELIEITPQALAQSGRMLHTMHGFNITIPHKVAVIAHLAQLSPRAKLYGAVNTVANEKGALIGHNTDVDGFLRCVDGLKTGVLSGRVLLYGCGGAGRMMAIESCLQGASLTLAVRGGGSNPKAVALVKDILSVCENADVTIAEIEQVNRAPKGYDILLNSTPVGMYPHGDGCVASKEAIQSCRYVFDAVYNPTDTVLLHTAREILGDACVCGGMGMLVWQAVAAHEIWDGAVYERAQIQALIKRMEALLEA